MQLINLSDNILQSEMLLDAAKSSCRSTFTKNAVVRPGLPWRKGIRNLTVWWRMKPFRLPCIRNELAGDTNKRIHRLLASIAEANGHSRAEQHLLEGPGFTGTVVQPSTIRNEPNLDNFTMIRSGSDQHVKVHAQGDGETLCSLDLYRDSTWEMFADTVRRCSDYFPVIGRIQMRSSDSPLVVGPPPAYPFPAWPGERAFVIDVHRGPWAHSPTSSARQT